LLLVVAVVVVVMVEAAGLRHTVTTWL